MRMTACRAGNSCVVYQITMSVTGRPNARPPKTAGDRVRQRITPPTTKAPTTIQRNENNTECPSDGLEALRFCNTHSADHASTSQTQKELSQRTTDALPRIHHTVRPPRGGAAEVAGDDACMVVPLHWKLNRSQDSRTN